MLPLIEELDWALSPAEILPAFYDQPYGLFLDSGMSAERLGRYSYITADPQAVLRSKGDRFELWEGSRHSEGNGDPFRALQRRIQRKPLPRLPGLPPFQGGWAGYFGYELGRHVESLPNSVVDDVGLPDMYLCRHDWVLAHDHLLRRTWLFADGGVEGDVAKARQRLDWVRAKVERYMEHASRGDEDRVLAVAAASSGARSGQRRSSSSGSAGMVSSTAGAATKAAPRKGTIPLHANFTHDEYLRAVKKIKDYIAAGDIYQANLTQRFDAPLPCGTDLLYRTLRQINPAPYAAHLRFPDLEVLSASPEEFLKLDEGLVETRPIKGTRPRGATPDLDAALARELVESAKDRAENLMIVDLLRNDLGRVCEVGSVAVPELFVLEEYPTVFHLVSTVVGRLPGDLDAVDLLRACFPGGSITGAPKIRAMEIIDEVEPTERGIYCGAIGYLGSNGTMNTSIVIRTMVVRNGRVYFQVGGAIVADSDPQEEYQETLDKARAIIMALERTWTA